MRGRALAGVAQAGGDAVDRQVDAALQPLHAFLALAPVAVAAQQFDLQVVERVEIGEAMRDRARQRRVALQPFGLAGDQRQCLVGAAVVRVNLSRK